MSIPQPKDILCRAGGLTLERFGVAVYRRAPISRLGEEWLESFARADGATPVATYRGRDGLVHASAQNTPRFEYLSVDVGDGKGAVPHPTLLIEGARTNLIENGDFLNDIVGVTGNNATPSQDAGSQLRAGGKSLKIVTTNVANSGAFFTPRAGGKFAVTANQIYTATAWVLPDATSIGKTVKLRIEWYTGAGALISASELVQPALVAGRQRLVMRGQAAPATAATALLAVYTDVAQGVFNLWVGLVQLELGTFETSAIITNAGAATRVLEVFTVPIGFGGRDTTALIKVVRPILADLVGNLNPGVGAVNPGFYDLGDSSVSHAWCYSNDAGRQLVDGIESGGAGSISQPAIPAGAAGSMLAFAHRIKNTATSTPSQEIETAAGTLVAGVGTGAPLAAYANRRVHVGGIANGNNPLWGNLLDVILADGAFSLADMLGVV